MERNILMKLFNFKKTIKKYGFKKGQTLLMADKYATIDEITPYIKSGDIVVQDLEDVHTKYDNHDLDRKSLLLFRYGGFGDILFATPLLRYLRKKYQYAKIHFACDITRQMILQRNKDLSRFGVHNYPVTWDMLKQYDYHLHFDEVIERNPEAEKIHCVDLFLKRAGIDYSRIKDEDKIPIYEPDSSDLNKVRNLLTHKLGINKNDMMVAMQMKANSAVRTLNPRTLYQVIFALANDGIKVMIIGGPMDNPIKTIKHPNIYDLSGKLKMAASVALMKYCKLVIAPDSAMTHFAAAMNVPCISIYGPFPSDLRTRYYPMNLNIEPEPEKDQCWPCFDHSDKCPKLTKKDLKISPCLNYDRIPGDLLYRATKHMIGLLNGTNIETRHANGLNNLINLGSAGNEQKMPNQHIQ